jgi:hypothetical protein
MNDAHDMKHLKIAPPFAPISLLTLLSCAVLLCPVRAQDASAPKQLSDAEVKAKYQNCPNGYYSGPRPGKTYYTKDKWVWAVTPEFAKNFCMPPEFVSAELKGAEAVAYKLVEDQDEERCGWGGNAEVCGKRTEHRFEIYYRNGTIPKELQVPYFHAAHLPSTMLITESEKGFSAKLKSVKTKPRVGALGPFETTQFGLEALGNGKVAWPLGSVFAEIYYEDIFEGIDYLAVEGASGFSRQEGWIKSGSRKFAITVEKLNESRRSSQIPLNEFALIIELPQAMSDRIIANDQARGTNLKAMAQEAMKPGTTPKH